jgi:hypothetical protein
MMGSGKWVLGMLLAQDRKPPVCDVKKLGTAASGDL